MNLWKIWITFHPWGQRGCFWSLTAGKGYILSVFLRWIMLVILMCTLFLGRRGVRSMRLSPSCHRTQTGWPPLCSGSVLVEASCPALWNHLARTINPGSLLEVVLIVQHQALPSRVCFCVPIPLSLSLPLSLVLYSVVMAIWLSFNMEHCAKDFLLRDEETHCQSWHRGLRN